jgi:hypothetical protein
MRRSLLTRPQRGTFQTVAFNFLPPPPFVNAIFCLKFAFFLRAGAPLSALRVYTSPNVESKAAFRGLWCAIESMRWLIFILFEQ